MLDLNENLLQRNRVQRSDDSSSSTGYLYLTTDTESLPKWSKTHYYCLSANKQPFQESRRSSQPTREHSHNRTHLLWQKRQSGFEDAFVKMCDALETCRAGESNITDLSSVIGQWFYCSLEYIVKIYDNVVHSQGQAIGKDIESWLV